MTADGTRSIDAPRRCAYQNPAKLANGTKNMILWLASYPRSGNTFTRSVLKHYFDLDSYSVHGDTHDIAQSHSFRDLVGHIDGNKATIDIEAARRSDEIVAIKTHDAPSDYMSNSDMFLYIHRDGRDSIASYQKYMRRLFPSFPSTKINLITGNVPFGSWGSHSVNWMDASFQNSRRLRFENITPDPDGFADTLAELLGRERSREPFPSIEVFQKAAPGFVNQGAIGKGKESFSDLENDLFDIYCGPAMRLLGYEDGGMTDREFAAYRHFWWETESKRDQLIAAKKEISRKNRVLKRTGISALAKFGRKTGLTQWLRSIRE